MMGKYKHIGGDCWVHEDLPLVPFPKKPPEWIADHLMKIYIAGFSHGEQRVQSKIADALEFLIPDGD